MKKAIATLILTLGLTVSAAQAQELPNLKLKSMTTAVLLGIDPIPGDALFYAGRPVQGTVNMVLGGASAVAFFSGLNMYLSDHSSADEEWGGMERAVGTFFMIVGGIPYGLSLIWDLIGGTQGVFTHNERVQEQQTSLWQRVQPTVAVTGNGAFGGVRITF